jgi:exodeoxyribonuclease VII large subunit
LTLPLFDETYTVSRLCEEVKSFLAEAFASVWVAGEVQRLRESKRGHLYFELIEKDDADHVSGKLEAVLWRGDRWRVERALGGSEGLAEALAEGTEVRLRAGVDFYGPAGRLQLAVREVDPVYALGLLERRRRETLAALAEAGLLEANRARPLSEAPLAVALVTSHGSAAYHDFVATLGESGWGFRVLLLHAAVQGRGAERELVSALEEAGRSAADCVVLVRGGGARSDLAAFDRPEVAEAVARCPLPVLTGLGHEIDESIADRVAHTRLKTPTQAAAFLVERVDRAERARAELAAALDRAARERLRSARERVGRAEQGLDLGRLRLRAAGERLGALARGLARLAAARLAAADERRRALAGRLAAAAPRPLRRAAGEAERLAGEVARRAAVRLAAAGSRLGGLERLCAQLAPARVLERGFSITRDAAGAVLRDPARVAPGDLVVTTLSGGTLTSRAVPGRMEES